MELRDFIRLFRKNWLTLVALTAMGLSGAVLYTATRTPEYESASTIFVSTQAGSSAAELQQGSSFTQARINTYVGLVTTPVVLEPVIEQLGLETTPQALASRVRSSAALNSSLITISVSDTDPQNAASIANAVAASLSRAVPQLETEASDGSSPVRLSRVSEAQPALKPSTPIAPLNLGLGTLLGLTLGVGIALLRGSLDNRVRTPRDAEEVTNAPGIGAIAFDAKAKERPLIVHVDPLSPRAESFRALRTNLQFLDMGGRSSFVITSSIPSEGKSTTTINLAIALADAGKRVALIDTDLRKPKVAEYLGIEGGAGLTDVLIGRAQVNDVMLPWGGRSLYVLPAGKIPPNPSELLGSARMGTLISTLEEDFDVVLCDAPPLLPVTDAAILARVTSGALMVISAGKATRHQLTLATEALGTVGAKLAGFVMSMVPTRGPDSYYSAYGYGYGYTYSEPADASGKAARRRAKQRDAGKRRAAEAAPPTAGEAGFSPRRTSREANRGD
ncbi:capsular exopolysaccharide synthesis family protein [Microbacterium sp. SORGH_AS 1204]|uniref:polysaccharide biosynthesis tyrosine autokinase n=1 Tax=Microbacterium sp. SORGH_AS_1204 TaxID=3041785 RepID=UPI002791221F|nr:polysaccharide biosynthesis tyrosine autokinase [Microbacterium sp. SORGH_AS_1204]MDQ1137032.1 capsular exopolysaccharide synthesis family protein [Microbacterium sp. SORGH_AS_1204]